MLLVYGMVAGVVIGSGIGDMILNIFLPEFDRVPFLYMNPFTPLFMQMEESLAASPDAPIWWVTPAVHAILGSMMVTVAALRIRKMRD